MTVFKKILLSFFVLIIIFIVFLLQVTFRFDLSLNPIAGKMMKTNFGDRVELVQNPFEERESRKSVIRKLNKSGFKKIPNDQVWARYQYEIENGREIYAREAANIVCNSKIYVFIDFDQSNHLIFAQGTKHGHACL